MFSKRHRLPEGAVVSGNYERCLQFREQAKNKEEEIEGYESTSFSLGKRTCWEERKRRRMRGRRGTQKKKEKEVMEEEQEKKEEVQSGTV